MQNERQPRQPTTWPLFLVIIGMTMIGVLWAYAGVIFSLRPSLSSRFVPVAIATPKASTPTLRVRESSPDD